MKSYLVGFETHEDEYKITTVEGENKQKALDTLINCKKVLWSHLV